MIQEVGKCPSCGGSVTRHTLNKNSSPRCETCMVSYEDESKIVKPRCSVQYKDVFSYCVGVQASGVSPDFYKHGGSGA